MEKEAANKELESNVKHQWHWAQTDPTPLNILWFVWYRILFFFFFFFFLIRAF